MVHFTPPLQAGELLGSPSYFRAVFEPLVYGKIADNPRLSADLYSALRNDVDYISPINDNEWVPGESVFVYDVRIFPVGGQYTAARLARDLNNVKFATSLRTLTRIDEADAYGTVGAASRSGVQADEQNKSDAESVVTKFLNKLTSILQKLGWVLLIVVLVVVSLLGWTLYRKGAAAIDSLPLPA